MDTINFLIAELNSRRIDEHKSKVIREWTGSGNWLRTDEKYYRSVGDVFTNDDEFIGFLRGLIFVDHKE